MCVCVGVCSEPLLLYPLAVLEPCVFLMLISPSCWKAKHSLCTQMLTDVMCTTQLPPKTHNRTHTAMHAKELGTQILRESPLETYFLAFMRYLINTAIFFFPKKIDVGTGGVRLSA